MSEQRAVNDNNIPALTLGWRLRMAIEHADIKVSALADELGVTRGTISRWTHDDGTPPRDGFVRLIALRTGVPYEWVKDGIGDPEMGPDQGFPTSTWEAEIYDLGARRSGGRTTRQAA